MILTINLDVLLNKLKAASFWILKAVIRMIARIFHVFFKRINKIIFGTNNTHDEIILFDGLLLLIIIGSIVSLYIN